jgi:DNA-nicking Smr family endonuclease
MESKNEDLFFARTGLQHKTIKKLRQGKMSIEACLDLHGMTIPKAETALEEFLFMCQQEELRNVLIIHGKGAGIIKNTINTWLRDYPDTLAFCSAKPKDGGLGAVYLLLRKGVVE